MCTRAICLASLTVAGRTRTSATSSTMTRHPAIPGCRRPALARTHETPAGRRPAGVSWNVSGGALDLAGLEAGGADVDPLRRAGDDCAHALDVGVPAPLGPAVGVGDAVPEARALAADVAVGSHVYLLIVHATLVRRRWSGVRGSPGGDTAPGSRGCAGRAGQPR